MSIAAPHRCLGIAAVCLALAACVSVPAQRERYGRFLQPAADPGTVAATDLRMARMARGGDVVGALEAYAASDAIVFVPGPAAASDYLAGAPAFPPTDWQVHRVMSSCDGSLALSHGAITWGDVSGRYYTIWRRDARGDGAYRWVLSDGDGLDQPLENNDAMVATQVASCDAVPASAKVAATDPRYGGRAASADNSLRYEWWARDDGSRQIIVEIWNGTNYDAVFTQAIGPGS